MFSAPTGDIAMIGGGCAGLAFPWSVETLRARLTGLRGDVRARRMTGRVILALGGYGSANGDGWDVLGKSTKLFCVDRRDGERGDEINGALFDGE